MMHGRKWFQRSAALLLSSAVAVSGAPTAVFASEAEAFEEGSVFTEPAGEEAPETADIFAETAEPVPEAADEQEQNVEVFAPEYEEETDDMETEEENLFSSSVDEEEPSLFADSEEEAVEGALTGDYVYGRVNLPYADFYYGELNSVEANSAMNLEAADPVSAAGYRETGMYDAVTSATTEKSTKFDVTYYTLTDSGVSIEGLKDVNIAVPTSLYNDATAAIAEGKTCNNRLFEIINGMVITETVPTEYKVLNGDGTLGAMVTDTVVDEAATASITTESPWGNYQISVKSDKIPTNAELAKLEGVVIQTSDGNKYGMEHLENLWLQPQEMSFTVKEGFVEPHGNTVDYQRHVSLPGKTITQITYMVKDGADVVINTNLLCKLLVDGNGSVTTTDGIYSNESSSVTVSVEGPNGSSYYLDSVAFAGKTLTEGTDYQYADNALTVLGTENTGVGQYTVTFADATYENLKGTFVLSAGLEEGAVRLEDNKLVVDSDVYTVADYLATVSAFKIDGAAQGGRNVSGAVNAVFGTDGVIDFNAALNGKGGSTPIFTKGEGESYEIEIISNGFPAVTGTVTSPSEYKYVYAGLTWAEYWASENVQAAGDNSSSPEADAKGELDKGAFDTVTRATVNHGLHRGSYQCVAVIYGESGRTYQVSHWTSGTSAVLTNGDTITFSRGSITLSDGGSDVMDHYIVTGIKYVPVKVKTEDYEAFCEKYSVVEKDGVLAGGYSEQQLAAYTAAADVTENTNGLKTAVKNNDGSFSFSARTNGTESGLKDTALKTAEGITATVKEANGSYGEFLRVDLNGNYGELGAAMQAVKWTYYGNDSSYSTPLATYGTKFAADNWMHKSMGIQLGLTESIRCQLPEGTDGTGYWTLTVYALGYEDYTVPFEATDAHIVKPSDEEADTTGLQAVIAKAKALKKSDYTSESWAKMEMELEECEEMLAEIGKYNQAGVDEQIQHLENAIKELVKAEFRFEKTSGTLFTQGATSVTLKLIQNVNAVPSYTSSNTKVAVVDAKGVVTAKGPGTATITAVSGSYKAVYRVTVKQHLAFAKSTVTLYAKGTPSKTTLKVTKTEVNGTVQYTSSNTKVATVNAKGEVAAKKAGTATITAKCGAYTAVCKVTVQKPSLKLSKSKATLYTKGSTKLSLKTQKNGVSGTVKYSTSNKKVATVSSKGVVTAKKAGTVTITAKCGSYKATCKITVKKPTLKLSKASASVKKGNTVTIKAKATPSGKITYKSSNKKVASVNSKGIVKGLKKGKATITVTCNGVSKKFKVTVK